MPTKRKDQEFWSNGKTTVRFTGVDVGVVDMVMPALINANESMKRAELATSSDKAMIKKPISKDLEKERREKRVIRNSILAGSFAGVTQTCIFHPMDVLRTKVQSSMILADCSSSTSGCKSSEVKTRVSLSSVVRETLHHGGIRSLYTGLSLPVAGQALYKSCVFTTNTVCKSALFEYRSQERHKVGIFTDSQSQKLSYTDLFLCGGIGGMVNAFMFVTPIELVRNQLIAQDMKSERKSESIRYRNRKVMLGPFDVVRHIVQSRGLLGMWTGARVTVLRDFLGCGSYFLFYEMGKNFFRNLLPNENKTVITLLAGTWAGTGFWIAAAPLDTIKTHVQTSSSQKSMRTIWSEIGSKTTLATLKRLYSGWPLAFGRGAPSAAITLYTYEVWMDFLSRT